MEDDEDDVVMICDQVAQFIAAIVNVLFLQLSRSMVGKKRIDNTRARDGTRIIREG